jgi:hypothetical protein
MCLKFGIKHPLASITTKFVFTVSHVELADALILHSFIFWSSNISEAYIQWFHVVLDIGANHSQTTNLNAPFWCLLSLYSNFVIGSWSPIGCGKLHLDCFLLTTLVADV